MWRNIDDEEISSLRNRDFDDDVEDMIRRIPTFESCKASLYRSRAKVLPKLPKTQNDIALEGAWTETTAGGIFLLNDDTNELGQRVLVFATDSNLRMLCDSNTVFGDGTCCISFITSWFTLVLFWLQWSCDYSESCDFSAVLIIVKVVTLVLFWL